MDSRNPIDPNNLNPIMNPPEITLALGIIIMGIIISITLIMEARFGITAIFVMILFLICNSRSVIMGHFYRHYLHCVSVI